MHAPEGLEGAKQCTGPGHGWTCRGGTRPLEGLSLSLSLSLSLARSLSRARARSLSFFRMLSVNVGGCVRACVRVCVRGWEGGCVGGVRGWVCACACHHAMCECASFLRVLG